MSDDTDFVIVPQSYPMWAVLIRRKDDELAEPVIAWRIAVNDSAQRPVPICPMRGELNLDDIGDFVTTAKAPKLL
jgi:hypothetical protein